MLDWIFGKKCAICKKKERKSVKYIDDQGKHVDICYLCVPYAERRAYRKR